MNQKWKLGCVAAALMMLISGCGAGYMGYISRESNATAETTYDTGGIADYADDVEYGAYEEEPLADYEMDTLAMENPSLGGGSPQTDALENRKLIMTYDITMQTIAFDECVTDVSSTVQQFGGFVQSSRVEGQDMYNTRGSRSANFTLRVPVEKVETMTDQLGETYNIINKSSYQEDITSSYYDVEARLKSLRTQEARLMEMMEQSENLEHLLAVEQQLQMVIYEIESFTSAMQRMESSISMSTVNIYVYEVVKYEDRQEQAVTFGDRLNNAWGGSWKGFVSFCQGSVIFLIWSLPFLIFAVIVLVVVLIIVRARHKRRKNRPAPTIPGQIGPPQAPADTQAGEPAAPMERPEGGDGANQ